MQNTNQEAKEMSLAYLMRIVKSGKQGTFLGRVNPEFAKAVLSQLNGKNRGINMARVRFYAKQMTDKSWQLNGDSIRFSNEGELLDGQHRLAAVIASKQTIETYIAVNLDPSVFTTIDTGKVRNASDVVSIANGKKYATIIAATAGFVLRFKAGHYSKSDSNRHSNEKVLEFVNSTEGFDTFCEHGYKLYQSGGNWMRSSALFVGCYYLCHEKHPEPAREFFTKCSTLIGLKEGSPILALMKGFQSMNNGGNRASSFETKIKMLLRAFMHYRNGKYTHLIQSVGKMPVI